MKLFNFLDLEEIQLHIEDYILPEGFFMNSIVVDEEHNIKITPTIEDNFNEFEEILLKEENNYILTKDDKNHLLKQIKEIEEKNDIENSDIDFKYYKENIQKLRKVEDMSMEHKYDIYNKRGKVDIDKLNQLLYMEIKEIFDTKKIVGGLTFKKHVDLHGIKADNSHVKESKKEEVINR